MVSRSCPTIPEVEFPFTAVDLDPTSDVRGLDVVGALCDEPPVDPEAAARSLVVGWGLALPEDVKLNAMGIFVTSEAEGAHPADDFLPEGANSQLIDARAEAAAGSQVVLLPIVDANDGIGVHHVGVGIEADSSYQIHLPGRVAEAEPIAITPLGAGSLDGVEGIDRLVAGPLIELCEDSGFGHGRFLSLSLSRGVE
tara:strand:- start:2204 stop:2794 length:591 start_codon:yes stop_codon:yes gene_type:complete